MTFFPAKSTFPQHAQLAFRFCCSRVVLIISFSFTLSLKFFNNGLCTLYYELRNEKGGVNAIQKRFRGRRRENCGFKDVKKNHVHTADCYSTKQKFPMIGFIQVYSCHLEEKPAMSRWEKRDDGK